MIRKLVCALVLAVGPMASMAEDCSAAIGTYLTTKVDTSGVDKGMVGRTILSLASGNFATMTDSAQGGVQGYQAFGMMQGAWSCKRDADGNLTVAVSLLDFSYPNASNPDAKVALVNITGTVESTDGDLQGSTEVKLFPIEVDPFSGAEADLDVGYSFSGKRMPAP